MRVSKKKKPGDPARGELHDAIRAGVAARLRASVTLRLDALEAAWVVGSGVLVD